MIRNLILALSLLTLWAANNSLIAQSGAKWATGLNSIGNGDGIGTSNNFPLIFYTNNGIKMTLGTNGVLKINSLSGTGNRFLQADANGNIASFPQGNPTDVLYGNGVWGALPTTVSSWNVIGNHIFNSNPGNVGIGNNNPQYKLDVTGDAKISNNLYVGGAIITTGTVNGTGEVNGGNINVGNALTVAGNANLNGPVKITALAGNGVSQVFVDNNGNLYKEPQTPSWSCWPTPLSWNPGGNSFNAINNIVNPPPSDIGTCDNYDFIFKSNNIRRQWIKPDGTIGFGTNVGSNTFGPEYRFKTGVIRLQSTNTYGGPQIIFDLDDNSTLYGDWGIEYTKALPGKDGLNFWKPFGSFNSNNNFFFLADDGTVGIGTDNPTTKLTIDAWNNDGFKIFTDPNKLVINVFNKSTNRSEFLVKSNGYVFAREINVLPTNTPFPDYVFEADYKKMPLNELDTFLKNNKHLPNIPSAKEVEKEGINLAEMQIKQMEKIEELFLYVIELKKENEALKAKVEKLSNTK